MRRPARKSRARGTGTLWGSSLAEVRRQAAGLKTIHSTGREPWICVFQNAPRRWSYGIRFYPVGGAHVEHLTGPDYGTVVRPIEKGGHRGRRP